MSFTPAKQFNALPAVGNTENVPDILKKTLEAFDEQLPPEPFKFSPLKQWLPHVVSFSDQECRF